MILSSYPTIDLHGMDRDYASIVVKEFIEVYYKIGKSHLVIIHGVGSGILRKKIHDDLKRNKKVKKFNLDIFNEGQTLVELNKKI